LIHAYLGVLQFVMVVMYGTLIGIRPLLPESGIVDNMSSSNSCEQNSERVRYLCSPYN